MKKSRRILAIVLVAVLMFAVVAGACLSALAEESGDNPGPTTAPTVAGNGVDYTPVQATSTTFKKFLIIGSGDNVPSVIFDFAISAGDAISADTSDNDVMEVIPGVMPASGSSDQSIVISSAQFSGSDTTQTSVQNGDIDISRLASDRASGLNASSGVQFETSKGEKYAVKTVTVTFNNISFDEPGIYRYIISEAVTGTNASNASAMGIMFDNDTDRVLDVYVVDDGSGVLTVSQYVLHTSDGDVAIGTNMGSDDVATAGVALDDKTDGFTNEYNSKNLVFKKEVSGNQASRDKYFEFAVEINGVPANSSYVVSLVDDNDANTVDGEHASVTSGTNRATIEANQGKSNPTSVTANASGKIEQNFYLAHGQAIAIRGLPVNATYSVTENAEDYKSTGASVTGYTDAVSGTIGTVAGTNNVVKTSYTNVRDGIVPTGVVMAIVPYLVIGFVGVLCVGLFVVLKKRNVGKN